jgi:hypothetical protein
VTADEASLPLDGLSEPERLARDGVARSTQYQTPRKPHQGGRWSQWVMAHQS